MNNIKNRPIIFNKPKIKDLNKNKIEYFQNNNKFFSDNSTLNTEINNKSKKIHKYKTVNELAKNLSLDSILYKINQELTAINNEIAPLKSSFFTSIYKRKYYSANSLFALEALTDKIIKLIVQMHQLDFDSHSLSRMLSGASSRIEEAIMGLANHAYLLKDLGITNKNFSILRGSGIKIGKNIITLFNNMHKLKNLGFCDKEISNIFKGAGTKLEESINIFINNIESISDLNLSRNSLAFILSGSGAKIGSNINKLNFLNEQFKNELNILHSHEIHKILIYKTISKLSENKYKTFLLILPQVSKILTSINSKLQYENDSNLLEYPIINNEKLLEQFNKLKISLKNLILKANFEKYNKQLQLLKKFEAQILPDINNNQTINLPDLYETTLNNYRNFNNKFDELNNSINNSFNKDNYSNDSLIFDIDSIHDNDNNEIFQIPSYINNDSNENSVFNFYDKNDPYNL